MKNLYKQKRTEGFTIIEVLIVLAIAALILLIVFLAVPALQRNSRNNTVKNGAANLLAAANEFVSNNNGSLPTRVSGPAADGTVTFDGPVGSGLSSAETKVQGALTITGTGTMPASSVVAPPAANGTIKVITGYKCNGNSPSVVSNRSVSVLYLIENSGSTAGTAQCVDS